METGINSIEGLLTPARGFRSSRHTCRKPFFLILPSRRATKKVADHSSLQPLEWSAFDWLFRSCSRTGRRSSPTSFFWLSYGAADGPKSRMESRIQLLLIHGDSLASARVPFLNAHDDVRRRIASDGPYCLKSNR